MRKAKCVSMVVIGILLLVGLQVLWAGGQTEKKPQFAFITNGVNDFWILSQRGLEQAVKDLNVDCAYLTPPNGTSAEQISLVESMLAKKVDGIGLTVTDPDGMTTFLNEVAKKTQLVIFDSDAPKSNRILYLGTNNYSAGRTMGKIIKEVIPNGGKMMLFCGKAEIMASVERRQGIIDELKGVSVSNNQYTVSPAGLVACGKYTVLDLRTDNVDYNRAKQNAEDTIIKYPDIDLLVGLWAYNAPMILSALKDAGKQGKIPVTSFDELPETLQGIKDGYIYATVVQDPYNFGYRTVEILYKLLKGDKSMIPSDKMLYIPEKVINKENVDAFWQDMNKKLGK